MVVVDQKNVFEEESQCSISPCFKVSMLAVFQVTKEAFFVNMLYFCIL